MITTKIPTLTNFIQRCLFIVITIYLAASTLAQQSKTTDDWWTPILKKHNLSQNSYVLREKCCIVGKMTLENGFEIYKDVIIILTGQGKYGIYKSKKASFDIKNRILIIYDCSLDIYLTKGSKPILLQSMTHLYHLHNFKEHYSKTSSDENFIKSK